MRIAVVCNDTRGGVEPYFALACGLQRAGHEVRAVVPVDFAPLFSAAKIPVAPLSGTSEAELHGAISVAEQGAAATMRLMMRELPKRMLAWTRETLAACEGVNLITGGVGGMVIGVPVAEKLRVPFLETHLQPVGITTDLYPGLLFPATPRWLGSPGFRFSHRLSEAALWMPFKGAMSSARKKVLGLKGPAVGAHGPVLYGYSRHVLPVPPCGSRKRHVTGYWCLPVEPAYRPPPALAAFLEAAGPVVSIGFGSMASGNPAAVTELILAAVNQAGVRAVLLGGWGALKSIAHSTNIHCVDAVPHNWLFPRVQAVVHHGGAGTTGAALSAGVPAIVVPFTMDQPFWGAQVQALGVGSPPIPRKRLTQQRLAAAIVSTIENDQMKEQACTLGMKIRSENGVERAVEIFARL